jgi:hypothetical protein
VSGSDRRRHRSELLVSVVALAGCAASQQAVLTIEPPSELPLPGPAGSSADKSDFVLSRQPVLEETLRGEEPIHVGDKWWAFRGDFLKLSAQEIRERDAAISDRVPPTAFWDEQTAIEAVTVWGVLCNQCHGGRRRAKDVTGMPPPPPSWGQGEGLFFGARRPYVAVFAMVFNGGLIRDEKRAMPAWRNVLAREQIWALLYFLEYQSGGIEGRFPPSLYPRMEGARWQ